MTFLQLPTLRVRFLVYKSTHPGADQSNLIIQQIKKCLNKFYNGSVRSTVEFIVEWTRGCAFRITSRFFFFYRCGSVPGKYQSYPWFPAGEVHWCWNYWQTRQLHPSHSLQTTGNTILSHDFESPSCTIIELTVLNDCNICCGPGRWFYSWSCALWTSLTVCCWRASPLWSSYSKASPVTLETSFLRLVHSDLWP